MMKAIRYTLFLMFALSLSKLSAAEKNDTTRTTSKHAEDRNVMLDASSTVKPRDIPIGLPAEAGGTMIMEDGLPVGTMPSPVYLYSHWVGGSSYDKMNLIGIEETLLRTENFGFSIDSYTTLGTDSLRGTFTGKTNNDGLINVDLNLNGRLCKNLYFTAGAYIYLDPTSTHPKYTTFVNKTGIYKLGITHRWGQSEASLLYKFTVTREGISGNNHGPFIYNGDGTVSKLNGFRLGRDSYMPRDVDFTYLDVLSGEMVATDYTDKTKAYIHDLNFMMTNKLNNLWSLESRLHITGTKDLLSSGFMEAGIDQINNGKDAQGRSITTADGQPFNGLMQRRVLFSGSADYFELLAQSELVRKSRGHKTNLGLSYWFQYEHEFGMDVNLAQTVQDDPQRLLRDGQRQWNYNMLASYGRGRDHYIGLFAIDDWQITKKLNIFYGLRSALFLSHYDVAVDVDGLHNNERHDKFHLSDGTASITHHKRTKLNLIGVARAQYQLLPNFFVTGEYVYSRVQRRLDEYTFDTLPSDDPYVKQLVRGGVSYISPWLDASLMASYITCRNICSTQVFTKQVKGVSETQGKNTTYDVGTIGITADATVTLGNFAMHVLATYQEPRYRNFTVPLTFSDGSTMTIDYNDKYVIGMSKVLLELDPCYTLGDWRLWVSARYYSRMYASMVNNVYYNSRWETFAGIDWQVTKRLALALSITNVLGQTGANGSISVADTVTDPSQLVGYRTAGSFIRPFTVGLSATYKF